MARDPAKLLTQNGEENPTASLSVRSDTIGFFA